VIHFDTSFLVDLGSEVVREAPGAAFEFIEALGETELLAISVHVLAELRVGAEFARHQVRTHEALDQLLAGFLTVYPDQRFAPMYARLWVAINRSKRTMPAMDLLIATAALIDDAPVVTRNVKDFSRIPGLRVLSY
jgi:tRNA(fMet)-specific endonuclease VapC